MGTPAFNPNSSFNLPAFDPSGSYQTASSGAPKPSFADQAQNLVDKLTTVTPQQEQGHSWLTNKAQEFGAGAIQGLAAPFVHPSDTLNAVGNMMAHPINTGKQMVQSAIANPAQFAGNMVGGSLLGEAAAPVAGAVVKGAQAAADATTAPQWLYESALKPSTTISAADRAEMVNTGLRNQISVSKGGMSRIGDLINDLNQKISAQIASDPMHPTGTIPALRNLDSVRARLTNQVTPQPDMAEIDQVQTNFLNNPKLRVQGEGPGPASIPAAEAQAMKQGTYQALGDKAYGELKGASIESQKALARGLKDQLAADFPQLSNLNAQESKLLDLGPVLEKAVNRGGNHQLISLGTPVAATSGGLLFGDAKIGAAIGLMKMAIDNPIVKSRLAIALSKGANIPLVQASARVAAYQATLANAASQSAASSAGNSSAPGAQ